MAGYYYGLAQRYEILCKQIPNMLNINQTSYAYLQGQIDAISERFPNQLDNPDYMAAYNAEIVASLHDTDVKPSINENPSSNHVPPTEH